MERGIPMFLRSGILFLAFFYCAVFCGDSASQSGSIVKGKSEFKVVKAKQFTFSCKVDGENLVAQVSYPTTGWVAVGFNPKKMMKGAQFILGAFANGKAVLSDEFGDAEDSHAPDTTLGGKNNIIAGDVSIDNGTTTMSFTIPLISGDNKDAVLERGKPITVIFAAGKKPDLKTKHGALGFTTITLD
jgi:hypothetical protein